MVENESISLKKYKNCIVISSSESFDKIVWNYSGRFYIGGWKNDS